MAIEYRLTLAGTTPVEQVAQRAMPDPAERPTGTPPLLAADLYEPYGFDLTVRAGRNGYYEVESDNGKWEWKPEAYIAMTFRMEDGPSDRGLINMLNVVRRLLDTGQEDAALILNGNWLLLTRFGGALAKHRRRWWDHYSTINDLIPG